MRSRFLHLLIASVLAFGTFNLAHGYGAGVKSANAHYLMVRELANTRAYRWVNLGAYSSKKTCTDAAANILKLEEAWACTPIYSHN